MVKGVLELFKLLRLSHRIRVIDAVVNEDELGRFEVNLEALLEFLLIASNQFLSRRRLAYLSKLSHLLIVIELSEADEDILEKF